MNTSRTYRTKINILSGLTKQILNLVLPFIIRTVVIYYLGSEYQGLSGLFTAILQLLSLAELGFSTAVVYAMYEPIACGNKLKVCALMKYLKRVYRVIGLVMLIVGCMVLPLMSKLIKGDIPEDINIYILFCIYLFNTVVSYWLFAYKSSLLIALQREDIVSNTYSFVMTATRIVQIILLIVFRNYYIFIIILPLGTIMNNICIQLASVKYAGDYKPMGDLEQNSIQALNKQIKALFISRIADVARNSLDNIVISAFIGLTAVTIYDNYFYIYSGLRGFLLVISTAMQASIGNSIVTESIDKNYKDLRLFTLLFMVISGWCTVCLVCLYQPFMKIWLNDDSLMLPLVGMFLFCFYFYEININNTVCLYINGNGFFWQCRWWYIIEAVGNLFLNILMGYFFGIIGIIIASIVTLLFFNIVPRINIIFRDYFKVSKGEFIKDNLLYFLVTLIVSVVCYFGISFITINSWFTLIGTGCVVGVCSVLFYCILLYKNNLFKDAIKLLKVVFLKKIS